MSSSQGLRNVWYIFVVQIILEKSVNIFDIFLFDHPVVVLLFWSHCMIFKCVLRLITMKSTILSLKGIFSSISSIPCSFLRFSLSQQLNFVVPNGYPLLFSYHTATGHGGARGVRAVPDRGSALLEILKNAKRHGVEEIYIPKYIGKPWHHPLYKLAICSWLTAPSM